MGSFQRRARPASRPGRRPAPPACHDASVSDEQIGILAHEQIEGPNPGYRIAYTVRITGPLPPDAVRHAAEVLSARHESLRSAFSMLDGQIVRRVHRQVPIDFAVIQAWNATGEPERRQAIAAAIHAAVLAGIDTAVPPLWRVRVLRFARHDHAVVWVVHHAISDGWSMGLLMDEFVTCLAEGAHVLTEPVPYRDYVTEQRRRPKRDAPPHPHCSKPSDHDLVWPDLDADRRADSNAGDSVERYLDADVCGLLHEGVRRLRATPNTILLAAWTALLARYAQSAAVRVAMTFADRQTKMLERVVGPCHATVPVTFPVGEDKGFAHHVAVTRVAVEAARTAALISGTPHRAGARTSFSVHPGGRHKRQAGDLTLEYGDEPIPGSVGDADVFAYREPPDWRLLMTFRRRAMGRTDADDVLRHFEALLRNALRRPDDTLSILPLDPAIPHLSAPRAWQMGPASSDLGGGLVARLVARVARTPDVIALVYGQQSLSYRELMRRAQALAAVLEAAGARAGDRIGIRAPRSPAVAVAQLAVRQTGAAFVPLDPTGPDERLAVIVEDAGLRLLVDAGTCGRSAPLPSITIGLDGTLQAHMLGRAGQSARTIAYDPDAEAYVLFTSGSTGRPKGVSCSERALLRVIGDTGGWTIGSDDVVLMCAPTTFDVSLFEMWNGLLAARRLVILDPASRSVDGLATLIVEQGVTSMLLVPRMFHDLLVGTPGAFRGVRQIFVGGDINSAADFARCRAEYPSLNLFATYGPTETGVVVTSFRARDPWPADAAVPIGSALGGARLAVVDARGRPLPPGVVGELLIGGDAVELGYVGRAEVGEDKFRPDPLEGRRKIYATGDIVKMRRDGVLEFLGRSDRQLKLGGYRIELAEIEAAALAAGQLDACIAAVRTLESGHRELVAALVPKTGSTGDDLVAAVRRAIKARLPSYMVPSRFCTVSHIPTSAHGKADLEALFRSLGAAVPEKQPPASSSTELVINLAAAVLGHGDLSGSTNFFAAGGHSLAAVDLCARLSAALGREIPVSTAFEAATLDDIAAQVDALLSDGGGRLALQAVRRRRAGCLASFAQHRLLLASRAADGTPPPVMPLPFRLFEPVDVEALRVALDRLVARHPVLATSFYRDRRSALRVRASGNRPALNVIDLTRVPAARRDALMRRRCKELMAAARDLEAEPPLRCTLFLCPPSGGVLLVVVDHIAYDGRSLTLLTRDLTRLYATGGNNILPRPQLSFLDYAAWEAERDRDGTIDRLAQAAAARLAHRGPSPWSADERLAVRAPHEAITTTVTVAAGTEAFRALAQRFGVTTFVAVLATVAATFMQAKPASNVRIALQTSTRVDRRLFDAMGPFMNTTYVDVPTNDAIDALARAIQGKILAAQADALVPIDRLLPVLAAHGQPAEIVLSDLFFSLYQDDGELDPTVARRIVPLDPQGGWDSETFYSAYAVTILATLAREGLSLRFGVHPAIQDRTLGRRFAEAMTARSACLLAPANP